MARPVTNPDRRAAVGAGCVVGVGWVEFGVVVVGGGDATTWVWCATTCIAVRARALRRRWRTGSLSLRGRASAIPGWRRGSTSTASLPRTRPAMWARSRTRPRRLSGTRRRPRRRGPWRRSGRSGRATLSWAAASDNVGVVRYNVHRGASAGFTPSVANRIAQPTSPATSTRPAPGSYFYKVTAEDAAGNIGPVSNEASATVTADTTAPSAPGRARRAGDRHDRQPQLDRARATTSVSSATTSTAAPAPASRPPPATGSRSRPGPATPTPASRPAATSTRSPPKTPPATSAPPRTRRPPPSPTRPRPPPPAPSPPASPAAPINLSWGAATDNVGVSRYNLHRGTTSGFTPSTANRIAQPTGLSHADTGLAPGTYFYKLTAEDAAGNIGPVSNTASATVADTSPPSTPTTSPPHGGAGQATLTWTAATDNVGVTRYNLHRSTSNGFTPTTANRIAQPTGTSYTDTGLAAGTYYYRVTAEDAAGNISPASNEATATVTAPTRHRPRRRLRLRHRHRHHHHRPIRHRQQRHPHQRHLDRHRHGKYGNALTFNGTNATVTIPDANSLDLTTGMTLEAWVRPTNLGNSYRTVADEGAGRRSMSYGALRATAPERTECRSARSTSTATATRSAQRSCR